MFAGVLALGMYLRVRRWWAQPSLWIDEARMALNIAGRSYVELLNPLAHDQVATVPFLWLEKFVIDIVGINELALRSVSLAASILGLVLFAAIARRLLNGHEALLAISLMAVSPLLVFYANDVKPYSTDLLAATALTLCAVRLVQRPESVLRWRTFGLVAGGGVLLSIPAVLALGGNTLALLGREEIRKCRKARRWLGAIVLGAFTLAALGYGLLYRLEASPYMHRFWAASFVSIDSADSLRRLWSVTVEVLWKNFVGGDALAELREPMVVIVLASVTVGTLRLRRSAGSWAAWLIAGPWLALFLCSASRLYPLGARVTLFAAPLLFLGFAAGCGGALAATPWPIAAAGLADGWARLLRATTHERGECELPAA